MNHITEGSEMAINSSSIATAGTPAARLRDIVASLVAVGPRLLAAARAWASASQLGALPEKEIGRKTGART